MHLQKNYIYIYIYTHIFVDIHTDICCFSWVTVLCHINLYDLFKNLDIYMCIYIYMHAFIKKKYIYIYIYI